MNDNNKLIIAAAGSGKTTYLIKEANKINKNVLITTYTEANAEEIKKKIIKKNGYIPQNITIQTWFSFLLQHGVRPYQSIMNSQLHEKKIGFYLSEIQSGAKYNIDGEIIKYTNPKTGKEHPLYWGEKDFFRYYFTRDLKIYSDKISKFIIEANKQTKGEVIARISRIYPYIFVDEVQDLAGWDLEIIKMLFKSSSNILLVGDPRQVTYLTHNPKKYTKYKNGKIDEFITKECSKIICDINTDILNNTHRNNKEICDFSSSLFPEYSPCKPCECEKCRNNSQHHKGIFLIKEKDIKAYCNSIKPTILKWNKAVHPEWNYGKSKGLTFENVLIYPTDPIKKWIETNKPLPETSRCKFYVAITRAKYSVGIVYNYDDNDTFEGMKKYSDKLN